MVETLDYLYKGGRCSAVENMMSSLLKIRPVLSVQLDGTLGVRAKMRGTRRKTLNSLLDDFKENLSKVDPQRVFVTHSGCDEDAIFLKDELAKLGVIEEIFITRAGSVVSSHCGPETIGILYLEKSD